MRISYWAILFAVLSFCSCSSSQKISSKSAGSISSLKFINVYVCPNNIQFSGTAVGGLSGIDYDKEKRQYYIISDDPGAKNYARYYTVKINISDGGIDSVYVTDVNFLKNSEGKYYSDIRADRIHSADIESIRYNPFTNKIIYATDGQRFLDKATGKLDIQDVEIVEAKRDGNYIANFYLPENMHRSEREQGPRHNKGFEGLTFSTDYKSVYASVEEPIYQDGRLPGLGDTTAWIRILKFDATTRKQMAQYAYELDAIPHAPYPIDSIKENGISEILFYAENKLIVMERSYSASRKRSGNDIRLYLCDVSGADDVSNIQSLDKEKGYKPVQKKLLFNLENLGFYIDNTEGITFGPVLSNGKRTLILVVDNDFYPHRKQQFFLFEINP
jgi:hypothetical protein